MTCCPRILTLHCKNRDMDADYVKRPGDDSEAIRERAGLLPNTEVEFVLDGDLVILVKSTDNPRDRRAARSCRSATPTSGDVPMTTARADGVDPGRPIDARSRLRYTCPDRRVTSDRGCGRLVGDGARATQPTNRSIVVINPIIFGELSVGYATLEAVDAALPRRPFRPRDHAVSGGVPGRQGLRRLSAPWRRASIAPLPDFLIGAHAAVAHYGLLTRDPGRYRTYFPSCS